jgi:hypothetical protein
MFSGWNWKHWLSVSLSTIVGGVVTGIVTSIQAGHVSIKELETAGAAGLLVAIASILHLNQTSPQDSSGQ